jgi:hypothetical protein
MRKAPVHKAPVHKVMVRLAVTVGAMAIIGFGAATTSATAGSTTPNSVSAVGCVIPGACLGW